ncbi:MAG TPA: GNAT family N-acetyltransferase, partial [Phycisphaerales bacterium]
MASEHRAVVVRRAAAADMPVAAELFREYTASIAHICAASFAQQNIEQELRTLPGKYAQPAGCILLAFGGGGGGGGAVGCVALRPIEAAAHDRAGERVCEMKRLYTRPAARGLGAGRRLCEELIAFARGAGYTLMKLDTEPELAAACALYRALGFVEIPRYNDDPN